MNPRVLCGALCRGDYRCRLQVPVLLVLCGVRLSLLARRVPSQNRLARRADFIEAAYARGMRRGLHQIRIGCGFFRNRAHGVDEKVALFLGFGFGGLDHKRARNDQRKSGGVWMEAVVDQALGDIHGADAILLLVRVAEYDFVHRWQGIREIVGAFEMLAYVVGVEHGVFRGLPDAGTVRKDVSKRAHQDAEIAREGFYAADGIGANGFEREAPAFFFHEDRDRAVRLEDFLHGDRAGAWAASAVWRGKRFVQIEMHHVNAEISRPRDAGKGVHVGAIHVQKRAFSVENLRDFWDALLENAERRRIGDHQRGNVGRDKFAQLVDIDLAVRFGLDVFDFVAGDDRGGRIRAVRGIGNQNFLARIALFFEIGAYQQQAR